MQSTPEWIWYPGEFEIWLSKKVHSRRLDLDGTVYPPVWRQDVPDITLWARKAVSLEKPERVKWAVSGQGTVRLDGQVVYENEFEIPAGTHNLEVRVCNDTSFPSFFLQGETIVSDSSWLVGRHIAKWVPAACGGFTKITNPPCTYRLPTRPARPVDGNKSTLGYALSSGEAILLDFSCEMYGYIELTGLRGRGVLEVRFGESEEEARHERIVQKLVIRLGDSPVHYVADRGFGFRYIYLVQRQGACQVGEIAVQEEYLPVERKGRFRCDDDRLNRIWEVSARTLELCAREFFLDGIKRDHWVWSGDAYQEILMAAYLFHDPGVCRRTLLTLRGRLPMEHHLNTILDYSFYWVLALWDYCLYSGDTQFAVAQYEPMTELLRFCADRANANGMVEGLPGDWVFVDWAPMDKNGELSVEQILYALALAAAVRIADLAGKPEDAESFAVQAQQLRVLIDRVFWDEERGAYIHNRVPERLSRHITKYPNMFALLFGMLSPERLETVVRNVLLNPNMQAITTPYMRFYELASLCQAGFQSTVREEIRSYWGGMLDLGATSFWEYYDPREQGGQHYAMYGDPFGKSLCHGWGASPLYLLGKYFLGVRPLSPGYERFEVAPTLGGLQWMEGTVPVPGGVVEVYMDGNEIRVRSSLPGGRLLVKAGQISGQDDDLITMREGDCWRVELPAGRQIKLTYQTPLANEPKRITEST